MSMIESFFVCSENGIKRVPSVFPPNIPKMEFFKPEYAPTQYEWVADGVTHIRRLDPVETRSMLMTPNRKYLVVDQNPEKYGPDNLLVLRPDGTEERRLKNPYPSSSEFRPDAKYYFQEAKVFHERILVLITASWYLPNRSRDAEPVYATFYDSDTWESTPLELMDSKNL